MPANPDADLTLPSVVAALPTRGCEQHPVLTIVFHPDLTRIGERACIPNLSADSPWILGRRSPAFTRAGLPQKTPLQERHVSRQALALGSAGDGLVLRRLPASSRCRVGGRELDDMVELSPAQLEEGVPILLGHSVVLLLKLGPWRGSGVADTTIGGLCGSSAYMATLGEQITRAAASDMDVLVRGETGTGKELVAAAIHRASRRSGAPLVNVNMAAIPPGLAAASLFGSTRGAFTGANKASDGFFSRAEGGTLFLDEIGDTPAEVQPQLLRALQQREIQTVGGAIRRVDVRVISATDAALEGEGCDFKAALRHRLGACEIHLLPLRGHPEDIGELLLHFLEASAQQGGRGRILPGEHSPAPEIAHWAELFYGFLGYRWPGNVRELANFAAQVVLASTHGPCLPDHICQLLRTDASPPPVEVPGTRRPPRRNIRDVDEAEFNRALQANGFEVANVARQLGVSRQAVYRRMGESPEHRLAGQVPWPELEEVLAVHRGDAGAAARDLKVSASGLRSRLRDSGLAWF